MIRFIYTPYFPLTSPYFCPILGWLVSSRVIRVQSWCKRSYRLLVYMYIYCILFHSYYSLHIATYQIIYIRILHTYISHSYTYTHTTHASYTSYIHLYTPHTLYIQSDLNTFNFQLGNSAEQKIHNFLRLDGIQV